MGLGNKKGHVQGSQVSGGHTTLIDGADNVVKKLGVLSHYQNGVQRDVFLILDGRISVERNQNLIPDTVDINENKCRFLPYQPSFEKCNHA